MVSPAEKRKYKVWILPYPYQPLQAILTAFDSFAINLNRPSILVFPRYIMAGCSKETGLIKALYPQAAAIPSPISFFRIIFFMRIRLMEMCLTFLPHSMFTSITIYGTGLPGPLQPPALESLVKI